MTAGYGTGPYLPGWHFRGHCATSSAGFPAGSSGLAWRRLDIAAAGPHSVALAGIASRARMWSRGSGRSSSAGGASAPQSDQTSFPSPPIVFPMPFTYRKHVKGIESMVTRRRGASSCPNRAERHGVGDMCPGKEGRSVQAVAAATEALDRAGIQFVSISSSIWRHLVGIGRLCGR